jgi:Tfp pilus assembly protein PilN
LKKRIRLYGNRASIATDEERQEIMKSFSELLDSQIEKIVLFMIERQGLLAGRLQRLRERREAIAQDLMHEDEDIESSSLCEHHDTMSITSRLMEDYR